MDPNGFLWMDYHRLHHLRQLRMVVSLLCALSRRDVLILGIMCVRTGQHTELCDLCK